MPYPLTTRRRKYRGRRVRKGYAQPRRRSPSAMKSLFSSYRSNPAHRDNPGITGIVMNGLWVGVGMWAGGMVNGLLGGITAPITGMLGPLGGIAQGLITAYAVAWLGNRTVGHGELMAAGAFAGTAMGAISGVLGGAGSIVSSVTGSLTGGSPATGTSASPDVITSPSVGSRNAQLRAVS